MASRAHAARKLLFPWLFVLLWSTGFIAAKYGLPYAPPLTFLWYRFLLVFAIMLVVCIVSRAPWPRSPLQVLHTTLAAWLVHGATLGGVFVALSKGMTAGTSSMLLGLQPLLTVFIARAWLGERVALRQWIGLALGLAGVWLVVSAKVSFAADAGALIAMAIALLGISVGTLYQKRYCAGIDLRSGSVVQFGACSLLFAPLSLGLEHRAVEWNAHFAFALGWSVVVLSVGAISVLYWLLRHGAAADVARLFYLVPPVTAWMAYAMFGETLTLAALLGMLLICVGVALSGARAEPSAPAERANQARA